MFKSKAEVWTQHLAELLHLKLSSIEFESLFHVLGIFAEKHFNLVSEKQWTIIMCVSREFLNKTQHCNGISFCLLRPQICELLLKVEVQRNLSVLDSLCCEMLTDGMYEVKHTVLDFLSCLQCNRNVSDKFCRFFENLDAIVYNNCKIMIFERPNSVTNIFVNIVMDLFFPCQNYVHLEENAKILLVLRSWKKAILRIIESVCIRPEIENLDFLVSCCRDSHHEVALNSIYCLTEFMYIKVSIQSVNYVIVIVLVCYTFVWVMLSKF